MHILIRILEIAGVIYLILAVWFFGFLSERHQKQSRWWINLVVAAGWPLAWIFAQYLRRRLKKK